MKRQANYRKDLPAATGAPEVTLTPVADTMTSLEPFRVTPIQWAGVFADEGVAWFVEPYDAVVGSTGFFEVRLLITLANPDSGGSMGISIWVDGQKYSETTWVDKSPNNSALVSRNEAYDILYLEAGQALRCYFYNGDGSGRDLYTGTGGANQFNVILLGT